MKDCIVIKGEVRGVTFRPGTPSPDMHWSGMLLDMVDLKDCFSIKWVDGKLCVTLTKDSWKEDETKFEHIMRFCKLHELDVEIDKSQCSTCEGHKSCLSGGIA